MAKLQISVVLNCNLVDKSCLSYWDLLNPYFPEVVYNFKKGNALIKRVGDIMVKV